MTDYERYELTSRLDAIDKKFDKVLELFEKAVCLYEKTNVLVEKVKSESERNPESTDESKYPWECGNENAAVQEKTQGELHWENPPLPEPKRRGRKPKMK